MTNTNCLLVSLMISLAALLTLSCNNATEIEHTGSDSSAAIVDSVLPPLIDTTVAIPRRNDSMTIRPPVVDTGDLHPVIRPVQGKSATLGYSYFPQMSRGETKDINVYVSVKNPSSRIRDTLKVIVQDQRSGSSSRDDTSVIYTTNVIVYEALDISLIDPANDFTIKAIHPSDRQMIDTVDGNRWRWTIVTNTNQRSVRLILKVIAEKPGGIRDRFDDRTIPIDVQIDENIMRRFFNYLTDNPAVSVPILVSLFGFLGWYIKSRKKKEMQSGRES